MKEPRGEGVASHTDPESCADVREGGGEALTGGNMGRALSHETVASRSPTLSLYAEGNTRAGASASRPGDRRGPRPHARDETPHAGAGRPRGRPSRRGLLLVWRSGQTAVSPACAW